MPTTTTTARALTLGAVLLAILTVGSCSLSDQSSWNVVMQNQTFSKAFTIRSTTGVSDDMLAHLRTCESHGNYQAVSASGSFRGAYQFARGTWNHVASQVLPDYNGTAPIAAPPYVQDAMARALWAQTGPSSWPVCGRRV
jgi:hypothetical protein